MKRTYLILAYALAVAGCSGHPPVGLAPNIDVTNLAELPAPANKSETLIRPLDSVEVIVTHSELLSGTFLADGSGYLSYPLVGDLYVAGKNPRQVASMIADRLRGEFVVNPQVRVRPTSVTAPSISIGGEVKSPGTYPAGVSQTLVRAVNNAGGFAEYAKRDDVLIMRTVEGKRYIGVYNLAAIQRGNYPDPAIYADDIITVGDSASRRRLDAILGFVPLLTSSLVLIDQTLNR